MKFVNSLKVVKESFLASIEREFNLFVAKYPQIRALVAKAESIHREITVSDSSSISSTAQWSGTEKTIKIMFPATAMALIKDMDDIKELPEEVQKNMLYRIFDSIVFELCNAVNEIPTVPLISCASRDIYTLLKERWEYESDKLHNEVMRCYFADFHPEITLPSPEINTWANYWHRVNSQPTPVSHAEEYRKTYDKMMGYLSGEEKSHLCHEFVPPLKALTTLIESLEKNYTMLEDLSTELKDFDITDITKLDYNFEQAQILQKKIIAHKKEIAKLQKLKSQLITSLTAESYEKHNTWGSSDPRSPDLLLKIINLVIKIDTQYTPIISQQTDFYSTIETSIADKVKSLKQLKAIKQQQEYEFRAGIEKINAQFRSLKPLTLEEAMAITTASVTTPRL